MSISYSNFIFLLFSFCLLFFHLSSFLGSRVLFPFGPSLLLLSFLLLSLDISFQYICNLLVSCFYLWMCLHIDRALWDYLIYFSWNSPMYYIIIIQWLINQECSMMIKPDRKCWHPSSNLVVSILSFTEFSIYVRVFQSYQLWELEMIWR